MKAIKFGTDGVRGLVGQHPIEEKSIFRIGFAAGRVLAKNGIVLIGRDTRGSGKNLESAICSGLIRAGAKVKLGGVLPTAAVSLAVKTTGSQMGVMITASHNPATDNGIKLFAFGGGKISNTQQKEIEQILNDPSHIDEVDLPASHHDCVDMEIGNTYRNKVRHLMAGRSLSGLKLVVDCANGSACYLAPELLAEAGAEVIAINYQPDGDNINQNCGSTYPEDLQAQVIAHGADAGIAFDGDADRVILVDETGALIDGDQILARLATDWQASGKLRGQCVVATIMSNMGLGVYLASIGVRLERTAVGDRHVAARMSELDANLGGEQSGHILLPEFLPSGDGLISGLLPLLSLAASGDLASRHLKPFCSNPQLLQNVTFGGGKPLEDEQVKAAIAEQTQKLGEQGRILVRASGTEPLIRIMAEAEHEDQAKAAITQIADAIAKM